MQSRKKIYAIVAILLAAIIIHWNLVPARAASQAATVTTAIMAVYDDYVQKSTSRSILSRQRKTISEVIDKTLQYYFKEIPGTTLSQGAIKGIQEAENKPGVEDPETLTAIALTAMLKSLDPHSAYLNSEQFKDMQVQTKGEFGGLGIEVTMEDDLIKVVSPIDDTPAFRAGMRAGDLITHLDGESVRGKTLSQAVNIMRGRIGTTLNLTVRREGREPFDVSITRGKIVIRSVRYRMEDEIGYLRVSIFSQATIAMLKKSIRTLQSQHGNNLKGFVLDLRNNPGGLLDQAVAVSDAFLHQGTVVSTRSRLKNQNQSFSATPGDLVEGLPVVVLVNGGSASASEIVTGALQDYRRATVFGQKSFGKGSVQTIMPLKSGGAIRLTTSMYHTPMGRPLQGRGIIPDVLIQVEPSTEATKLRREADLAGALPSTAGNAADTSIKIPESSCPGVGEEVDRTLNCALAYLKTGSMGDFVASLKSGSLDSASATKSIASPSGVAPLAISYTKGPSRPDDIAVIIGNADYGKLARDIPNVGPAYADAESFKRYVIEALGIREGNIIDLRDATGSQMSRVFGNERRPKGQLFDWVRPGRSNVIIYYAGHGAPSGEDGSAYLVPSDADAARIDINGFPLNTFYQNLSQLPAKSITVVLEACFSGAAEGGSVISNASPVFLKAKGVKVPKNVTVIAAGGANQMASWEEDKSHGLFTKYYLMGMSGEADVKPYGNRDGKVDYTELDAYLKDTLTYYARRYYGRDQTARIVVGGNE